MLDPFFVVRAVSHPRERPVWYHGDGRAGRRCRCSRWRQLAGELPPGVWQRGGGVHTGHRQAVQRGVARPLEGKPCPDTHTHTHKHPSMLSVQSFSG